LFLNLKKWEATIVLARLAWGFAGNRPARCTLAACWIRATSWHQRENLIATMVKGNKDAPEPGSTSR
jgi:cytochrome b